MDVVIAILLFLTLEAILWIFVPGLFFNLLALAKFLMALMFFAQLFGPVAVRMAIEIMETSATHGLAERAMTADTEQGFFLFSWLRPHMESSGSDFLLADQNPAGHLMRNEKAILRRSDRLE